MLLITKSLLVRKNEQYIKVGNAVTETWRTRDGKFHWRSRRIHWGKEGRRRLFCVSCQSYNPRFKFPPQASRMWTLSRVREHSWNQVEVVLALWLQLIPGWHVDDRETRRLLCWSGVSGSYCLSAHWRWALREDELCICSCFWWGDTKWWQNRLPAISVLEKNPVDSAVTKLNYMTLSLAWPWEGVITRLLPTPQKGGSMALDRFNNLPTAMQLANGRVRMSYPWFQWFSCRCHRWLFLFVCNYITSFFF